MAADVLGEVVLAGVADGGGPVGGAGLGEDAVDVALDGVSAQVQVAGDVGVGSPSGDHGQYFRFPFGEPVGKYFGQSRRGQVGPGGTGGGCHERGLDGRVEDGEAGGGA